MQVARKIPTDDPEVSEPSLFPFSSYTPELRETDSSSLPTGPLLPANRLRRHPLVHELNLRSLSSSQIGHVATFLPSLPSLPSKRADTSPLVVSYPEQSSSPSEPTSSSPTRSVSLTSPRFFPQTKEPTRARRAAPLLVFRSLIPTLLLLLPHRSRPRPTPLFSSTSSLRSLWYDPSFSLLCS